MKLQLGFRLFLPVLLLAMVALLACSQDGDETPAPAALLPTREAVEPARPLTGDELAAVERFEQGVQAFEADWRQFYQEFDNWRSGLTSCHPSSARQALRDFAASFTVLADAARNLPRASNSQELADLMIAATDAEDSSFRQLRDRWQAGNISLFETVEQKKAESALAHNIVADMSLSRQQELEEGPTAAEVEGMKEFRLAFDGIADAWDDFHDNYAALAKRESKLESDALGEGYEELILELEEIFDAIAELTATEINEDMIEALQDAAEDELAALEFLAEFPAQTGTDDDEAAADDDEAAADGAEPAATATPAPRSLSAPAQGIVPVEPPQSAGDDGPGQGETPPPGQGAPSVPPQPPAATEPATSMAGGKDMELSPQEELSAAVEATEGILGELDQAIEKVINDDSAVKLQDLEEFDREFEGFVGDWNQFYEVYIAWRSTEGGCDRVEVVGDLARFSQQAGELAGAARDLPQSGPLLPVYSLVAEAADREAGAFRTLSNSWTPFAVDVFKAIDDERVNAGRLRRQASIALEELQGRQ